MSPRRSVPWSPLRRVFHRTRPSILAWSLWVHWLALSALAGWLWLQVRAGDAIGPFLAGYATVGALVAARHPRNAVGWLLILLSLIHI